MKKILIIGGTGMLGKPVAVEFKKQGYHVVILTRDVSEARIKMPTSFEFAEGDVKDKTSLEKALDGCYGVHINLQGGPKFSNIEQIEHQGVVNIVDIAKKCKVEKISYISGATVKKENTWFEPTKAKFSAEEYIRNSGIDYTIFRPSWFFESLELFIRNEKATVIGKNNNKYFWVAAEDYAKMVTKSYSLSESSMKTFYVFGPESMTIEEALIKYCNIKYPDIKFTRMSTGIIKFLGIITFSDMLKFIGKFSTYFTKVQEEYNSSDTLKTFGPAETTLEVWAGEK